MLFIVKSYNDIHVKYELKMKMYIHLIKSIFATPFCNDMEIHAPKNDRKYH
jgi:hypothetical protein